MPSNNRRSAKKSALISIKKRGLPDFIGRHLLSVGILLALLCVILFAGLKVYKAVYVHVLGVTDESRIDVVDFMRAKFNYNGFTENNAYLALGIHSWDAAAGKWQHSTELSTCPTDYGTCQYTNWKARNMSRQKDGENIIYHVKTPHQPGKTVEVFWYNDDSIYDFQEPYSRVTSEYFDVNTYGLFHNLFHLPENNDFIKFPYRGQFWSKRYVASGEVTPWIYQVQAREYKNMKFVRQDKFPYYYRIRSNYYSNWDGSRNTWNKKAENGNLPSPLEVIELKGESKDDSGKQQGQESYFYGKQGSNSFGLIRYESWTPRETACGSTTCCTSGVCDGGLMLTAYNTFTTLRRYDAGEDPNQYFSPSFYSDPKLEAYPGDPSNGAIPRGRFKLKGDGQTTDGKQLHEGDWMQITEILTDDDWMLSQFISPSQCPNGYRFLGSFATDFVDHAGKDQGYNWVVLCGTNARVLLATSCPADYQSRGGMIAPSPETSAYDYQGRAVGGKRVEFCAHKDELTYTQQVVRATSSPIPVTPSATVLPSSSPAPRVTPTPQPAGTLSPVDHPVPTTQPTMIPVMATLQPVMIPAGSTPGQPTSSPTPVVQQNTGIGAQIRRFFQSIVERLRF